MKKTIQTLLLMVAMLPMMANAEYVQLADGVYQDGSTLYIGSGVTSLGDLQVNPSEIYCYATIPPVCMSNTFTSYGATLHVPAAGMVSYFTTFYWYNFNNILSDAIEPLSVTMNTAAAELEIGQQLSLSATVTPSNATPNTGIWTSTDASVATVSGDGVVSALAIGECYILATCVDKVAICHLTVVNPRVTVTLDNHEARLLPNHTLTLLVTCSPIDVDLAVTSSNPDVAIPRLVNGSIIVVGVAEGTATITINAADGKGDPDSCIVTVYTEHGDVNYDGYINIADVAELVDCLLNGDEAHLNLGNGDIDKNGSVNIADVAELIDYLLNGYWSWDGPPAGSEGGHEWVNLGLPSGTLWATCNVGANTPEHYGTTFGWGETIEYNDWHYCWYNYRWSQSLGPNSPLDRLTKYCTDSYYGNVDNKTELDLEDDAAYVNWGPKWRMPTQEQQQELCDNCTCTWTTLNGVKGKLFTGPNGKTLFFPAAGSHSSGNTFNVGIQGYYWSRTLYESNPKFAYILSFGSKREWINTDLRFYGYKVRAVFVRQE